MILSSAGTSSLSLSQHYGGMVVRKTKVVGKKGHRESAVTSVRHRWAGHDRTMGGIVDMRLVIRLSTKETEEKLVFFHFRTKKN